MNTRHFIRALWRSGVARDVLLMSGAIASAAFFMLATITDDLERAAATGLVSFITFSAIFFVKLWKDTSK